MGFAGSKGASDRDILIPSVCFQLRGRPFIKPNHAKKFFDCKPLAWRSDHVANSMNAYFNQVHLINWLFYWRWCFYYSIPFSFNGFTSCSIADLLNLAHKMRHSRRRDWELRDDCQHRNCSVKDTNRRQVLETYRKSVSSQQRSWHQHNTWRRMNFWARI